ncbi:hypothetical protein R1sor_025959 [Riccia sorocarpa]|uniref:Trichome birefringence-like N-terminal domain-containing protein n=1 Tax=Riccia sorocarpa TaxID=122646 RepID=A0ABD3GBG9_9MARC
MGDARLGFCNMKTACVLFLIALLPLLLLRLLFFYTNPLCVSFLPGTEKSAADLTVELEFSAPYEMGPISPTVSVPNPSPFSVPANPTTAVKVDTSSNVSLTDRSSGSPSDPLAASPPNLEDAIAPVASFSFDVPLPVASPSPAPELSPAPSEALTPDLEVDDSSRSFTFSEGNYTDKDLSSATPVLSPAPSPSVNSGSHVVASPSPDASLSGKQETASPVAVDLRASSPEVVKRVVKRVHISPAPPPETASPVAVDSRAKSPEVVKRVYISPATPPEKGSPVAVDSRARNPELVTPVRISPAPSTLVSRNESTSSDDSNREEDKRFGSSTEKLKRDAEEREASPAEKAPDEKQAVEEVTSSSNEWTSTPTASQECDLYDGDWVYDPEGPLYTNATCSFMDERQNCMGNGRPDTGYLYWKWKPRQCDLPRFDAKGFLEKLRGKSVGFVGDSLARNQMQSLLCMLSQVETPENVYRDDSLNGGMSWLFRSYRMTVSNIWSPYFIKETSEEVKGIEQGKSKLFTDVLDETWTSIMNDYDVLIFSGGHWFLHPVVYIENDEVIGCHYCPERNLTEIGFYQAYRKAYRGVLDKVTKDFKGLAIVGTFTAEHFENGSWSDGGHCKRQQPMKKEEKKLEGMFLDLHNIVAEEFESTLNKGEHVELLDLSILGLLRADGHPGPYRQYHPFDGKPPGAHVQNDCLHLCLPGPVDTWNQFLEKLVLSRLPSLVTSPEPVNISPAPSALVTRDGSLSSKESNQEEDKNFDLPRENDRGASKGPADEKEILQEVTTTSTTSSSESTSAPTGSQECDLYDGDWVYDPEGPLYTNATCSYMDERQNCMRNGRPDSGYLYWKWKPRECDLPRFDSKAFLEKLRGKSVGFVGDSLARNQMESLLCMLSQVETPENVYQDDSLNGGMSWLFRSYQMTVSNIWSPYFIKETSEEVKGIEKGKSKLFTDVLDETWTSIMNDYDVLIFSGGHWFLHPVVYIENDEVIGCHYCPERNLTEIGFYQAYRKAYRGVLDRVTKDFKGLAIVGTFTAGHFENGSWSDGGHCKRQEPMKKEEKKLEGMNLDLHDIVVEEFESTVRRVNKGDHVELLDLSILSLLRADGHPGPYREYHPFEGKPPGTHVQNDCLHLCLPGPVDTWNQFLEKLVLSRL